MIMDQRNKLTILSMIYENKSILFGKFSDKITHDTKVQKWKEIAGQLQVLNVYHKDWKYLRDTIWQNFRKRTIEKRDNRLQTGSGRGKKYRYDDVDELVLKIIAQDSPVMEGLSVPESSGTNLKIQKMEVDLKIAKEKLEIAKRQRYKLDLEILKLERELSKGRPSSSPIILQSTKQNRYDEDILD